MLTHWRRVRGGANPAGYAYRTAFRLLSRGRRQRALALADAPAGASGPVTRAGDSALAADSGRGQLDDPEGLVTTRLAVAASIAAMPPRRRMCAVLCLVVGLPTGDVAAALGIAEGTVRKHVSEARDDLRQTLDP